MWNGQGARLREWRRVLLVVTLSGFFLPIGSAVAYPTQACWRTVHCFNVLSGSTHSGLRMAAGQTTAWPVK
jgi:hypothetical protein